MNLSDLKMIQKTLQLDEHEARRTSIYTSFLQDEKYGANLIVAFAAEHGVCLSEDDVVAYLNNMDDEEIDIEMTPEMLSSVSGGDKCTGA